MMIMRQFLLHLKQNQHDDLKIFIDGTILKCLFLLFVAFLKCGKILRHWNLNLKEYCNYFLILSHFLNRNEKTI